MADAEPTLPQPQLMPRVHPAARQIGIAAALVAQLDAHVASGGQLPGEAELHARQAVRELVNTARVCRLQLPPGY
jgi:hypothetical protein